MSLIVQHTKIIYSLFWRNWNLVYSIEIWLPDSTSMRSKIKPIAKNVSKMDKNSVSFIKESDRVPEREAVRENLPFSFSSFRNCIDIIDCTEILLNNHKISWLEHKCTQIIKVIIQSSIWLLLAFCLMGEVDVPQTRDNIKFRFFRNGFIWWLHFSRSWIFNWGRASSPWSSFKNPSFHTRKKQMTARDVDISRQIAHFRMHVERVIGQLKKFKILGQSFLYV